MNVVKEINRINLKEIELGSTGASWHDEYKDSAYIFVGGLHYDLTEGDIITIFSQYGEIMDINLPRDKETGKTKGFGFLMYEDQRSTVLAVDNLNGAQVLERTLRVDHVRQYKQPKVKGEDGEWVEPEEQSLNARPEPVNDEGDASDSSESSAMSIDPEDPMRDYLLEKRKEEKALKKKKKAKSKGKHKDETPEERAARKARKKAKKAKKLKSEGVRGVEELLKSLDQRHFGSTAHEERSREDGSRRLRSRERAPRDHDRRSRDISSDERHRSGSPIPDQRTRIQYHRRPEERDRSPYDGGRYVRHKRQGRSRSPYSGDRVRQRSQTPEEEGDRYGSSRRY